MLNEGWKIRSMGYSNGQELNEEQTSKLAKIILKFI